MLKKKRGNGRSWVTTGIRLSLLPGRGYETVSCLTGLVPGFPVLMGCTL